MTRLADKLADLAKRVVVNVPDRRNPEAWHAEKSEIARVLHEFELTNTAKTIFPGAEVINTRPPPTRPPVDWSKGDDLPLDMRAAG